MIMSKNKILFSLIFFCKNGLLRAQDNVTEVLSQNFQISCVEDGEEVNFNLYETPYGPLVETSFESLCCSGMCENNCVCASSIGVDENNTQIFEGYCTGICGPPDEDDQGGDGANPGENRQSCIADGFEVTFDLYETPSGPQVDTDAAIETLCCSGQSVSNSCISGVNRDEDGNETFEGSCSGICGDGSVSYVEDCVADGDEVYMDMYNSVYDDTPVDTPVESLCCSGVCIDCSCMSATAFDEHGVRIFGGSCSGVCGPTDPSQGGDHNRTDFQINNSTDRQPDLPDFQIDNSTDRQVGCVQDGDEASYDIYAGDNVTVAMLCCSKQAGSVLCSSDSDVGPDGVEFFFGFCSGICGPETPALNGVPKSGPVELDDTPAYDKVPPEASGKAKESDESTSTSRGSIAEESSPATFDESAIQEESSAFSISLLWGMGNALLIVASSLMFAY